MYKPVFVWQDRQLKRLNPEDVICLDVEKNYTRLYVPGDQHIMVRSTFASALKKLPPDMFIQVHRSIAVSILYIQNIKNDHLVVGGITVPISRPYYKPLLEKLNIIE